MSLRSRSSKSALFALSLAVSAGITLTACGGGGGYRGGKKSAMRQWLDNPSSGEKNGNKIAFPALQTVFEIPETLYVFKNCEEAGHSEDSNKWVPLVSCGSAGTPSTDGDGLEAAAPSGDSEAISLTFYLAAKERPVDERAVAFYNNEYKEAGLKVEELAFNDDYFDKTGIFAKLQIMDESGTNAIREIQQFMWPVEDVLFIARTEYPFGDTRAIQQDWKSIMPYFKVGKPKDE
jgi:hypothetical protein